MKEKKPTHLIHSLWFLWFFTCSVFAQNPQDQKHSYHFIDEQSDGDSPNVYAILDNTRVLWDGEYFDLSAGEFLNIGTVLQGDVIGSSKPLSIGSERSATDLPVPIEFSGTDFVIPLVRNTHYIYVKNISAETVDIEFFDGLTTSSETISPGEIERFDSGNNGKSASISSTNQVLVTHLASGNIDAYPVPPVNLEVFGVRTGSGHIGALNDTTNIKQYSDTGIQSETLINKGNKAISIGNAGNEGSASFVRIRADQPLAAAQIGDSDGNEQTAFLPSSMFANQYVLPVDTQYVAMGCIDPNTSITIYSPTGSVLDVTSCNAEGLTPAKAYFGSTNDGVHFVAGSRIESNNPIYLIYEAAASNDEHNLLGANKYKHSYHFIDEQFEGDTPAVYGIANNTQVSWKGNSYSIDAGEFLDIGVISQGDVIESNQTLAIGSNRDGTDMPVPIEFAGTRFALPLQRQTHYLYVKNTENYDTEISFYNGSEESIHSIPANSISRLSTSLNGVSATLSTTDGISELLLSHSSSANWDAYPVPPIAYELLGIRSGYAHIAAYEHSTTVKQYASNGVITETLMGAGSRISVIGSSGSQGAANIVRIDADKPVSAVQYADGDGGEQTAFLTPEMLATHFVLPVNTQYIAMGCTESNTEIEIFSPLGALVESIVCAPNSSVNPGKAYAGSTGGVQFEAGSRVQATSPIYLIYEASSTNDEHNLMGETDLDYYSDELLGLELIFSAEDEATITWAASNSATSYELQRSSNNGENWQAVTGYSGTATSYIDTNLGSGSYLYRVRACDTTGCTAWVQTADIAVTSTKPSAPRNVVIEFDEVRGKHVVTWDAPPEYVTEYTVYGYDDTFSASSETEGPNDEIRYYEIIWEDYDFDSSYSAQSRRFESSAYNYHISNLRIVAENDFGESEGTAPIDLIRIPEAPNVPTGLGSSIDESAGFIYFSWSPSTTPTGTEVYYELEEQFSDLDTATLKVRGYYTTNAQLFIEHDPELYSYKLRACSYSICSDWSDFKEALSEPPTGLNAEYSKTQDALLISWNEVFGVTTYELSRTIDSGNTWDNSYYIGRWPTFSDIDIHSNDGAIYYRVRACRFDECSQWTSSPAE